MKNLKRNHIKNLEKIVEMDPSTGEYSFIARNSKSGFETEVQFFELSKTTRYKKTPGNITRITKGLSDIL